MFFPQVFFMEGIGFMFQPQVVGQFCNGYRFKATLIAFPAIAVKAEQGMTTVNQFCNNGEFVAAQETIAQGRFGVVGETIPRFVPP